jgi:NADPH-dependent 2,4-dienoyl-CoA reductase/sulfur reductase-like enzyme/nitrite reductase/ring-hydroxylating ferredoxin subunit
MQHHLLNINELPEGEMKAVSAGEQEVLLLNVAGEISALFPKCTHYGAPLADGLLNGNRIICPWHHACFDARTGKHLEAPGIDGLPSYEVEVRGEEIWVDLPESESDRVSNEMASPRVENETTYAIVGGGAAAAYAAEGMREAGFTGRIVLFSDEQEVPYDRPNCSKDYLQGEAPEEWMPLRDAAFYKKHGIVLMKGHRAKQIDPQKKKIHFESGDPVAYDKLLVCTGGTPNRLPIAGAELDNVFTLRSLEDSRVLLEKGKAAKKAVIIGASFIGMEVAMSLQQLDCEVHVVAPEEVPFAKVFGKSVGQQLKKWHEAAGIHFHLGRQVNQIDGQSSAKGLLLDDETRLESDLIVMGVGVHPATAFLPKPMLEEDGSLKTDQYLQVADGIYAAGDIATYPQNGQYQRIEHWKVACQQGRIAGMNMAGAGQPYQAIPFFWSAQQDKILGYVGHAEGFDETIVEGKLDGDSFLVHYVKNDTIQATLSLFRDQELCAVQELMLEQRMPSPKEVKAGVDWLALVKG